MSCYNLIRTDMIKNILKGNDLNSLIDLDNNDTESFINSKQNLSICSVDIPGFNTLLSLSKVLAAKAPAFLVLLKLSSKLSFMFLENLILY